MVNYPNLTPSQQQYLPALIKPASLMAAKFEDSSHQLWHCETVDGLMVLKLCNHQTVETSTFWRGMNQLFAINFPASLAYINKTHEFVSERGELHTPEFIASEASVFVLARYVVGEDVEQVSDEMVIQLANHLAKLHQSKRLHWGAFHHAEFANDRWPIKLQQTLKTLAKMNSSAIPEPILQQALKQAAQLKLDTFSPIMLDLRWDQMLHQQGKLSAIVDMDAFVIGPRELELVLLEYQLSQHQADIFKKSYQAKTDWPDLTQQRYCYRVLLFLMNSLGETDIEKWMNTEIRWR